MAAYTIAALAPVISPPTDFYFPPISVTITDGSPNAVIHYTTDGTTPTPTSPVYGGTFTVTSPERVRAIATAPNLAPSAVTNADFDVMFAAAQPIISLPSGTYTSPQMVMITDATPGAVIYYTTNRHNAQPVFSGLFKRQPYHGDLVADDQGAGRRSSTPPARRA